MGSRKRGRDEMEASEPVAESSLLEKVRNTWEFANIMQYIFIFGRAVRIDEDLTIEVRSSNNSYKRIRWIKDKLHNELRLYANNVMYIGS